MTRRIILTAFAAIIAATMTTTALAASDAKNRKAMVLQKSDLPAGARLVDKFGEDPRDVYQVIWQYTSGGKQFALDSGAAILSPRLTTTLFREWRRSSGLQRYSKITLPKYGDEQVAVFARENNEAELFVRKGRVLWILAVSRTGAALTKAEAIAQLKLYAPKQMKRVGSG
jgi:hypothetical protein